MLALCIYGRSKDEENIKERLETLISYISEPLRIEENYTRIVSDLSSCGPAFISFFCEQFVEAAVEETGISTEEATKLQATCCLEPALFLTKGGMTPAQVQERVAVPGGITAKAFKYAARETDRHISISLIRTTHAKYKEDLEGYQCKHLIGRRGRTDNSCSSARARASLLLY